jgi:hypothetical protein
MDIEIRSINEHITEERFTPEGIANLQPGTGVYWNTSQEPPDTLAPPTIWDGEGFVRGVPFAGTKLSKNSRYWPTVFLWSNLAAVGFVIAAILVRRRTTSKKNSTSTQI